MRRALVASCGLGAAAAGIVLVTNPTLRCVLAPWATCAQGGVGCWVLVEVTLVVIVSRQARDGAAVGWWPPLSEDFVPCHNCSCGLQVYTAWCGKGGPRVLGAARSSRRAYRAAALPSVQVRTNAGSWPHVWWTAPRCGYELGHIDGGVAVNAQEQWRGVREAGSVPRVNEPRASARCDGDSVTAPGQRIDALV